MSSSIVDMMLASPEVSDIATFCGIHRNDHGSDHQAIRAQFDIAPHEKREATRETEANVRESRLERDPAGGRREWRPGVRPAQSSRGAIPDAAAGTCQQLVAGVLERRVERARPPPFAKKSWTEKLTSLRDSLSAARNSRGSGFEATPSKTRRPR